MGELYNNLVEYFENTPQYILDKDWKEINKTYMETIVNKEYQSIIDALEVVKNRVLQNEKKAIEDCQYAIKQLGSRVVLSEDAEKFNSITTDMLKTYIKKNHDYGNSFEQSLDKFGLVAGVVRIGDKMNRIESLTTKEAMVKDESIKDTLLDMANYCIMSVMWLNKQSE